MNCVFRPCPAFINKRRSEPEIKEGVVKTYAEEIDAQGEYCAKHHCAQGVILYAKVYFAAKRRGEQYARQKQHAVLLKENRDIQVHHEFRLCAEGEKP